MNMLISLFSRKGKGHLYSTCTRTPMYVRMYKNVKTLYFGLCYVFKCFHYIWNAQSSNSSIEFKIKRTEELDYFCHLQIYKKCRTCEIVSGLKGKISNPLTVISLTATRGQSVDFKMQCLFRGLIILELQSLFAANLSSFYIKRAIEKRE